MDEYYLRPMSDVTSLRFRFYLLYENGRNFFEEFVDSLKQRSELEELNSIRALMDRLDVNNLPPSKFRHISGGKEDRNDVYEFKSKHLRVYVLKLEPEIYVVLGGYKKSQEKDIKKVFRHFNCLPDEIEIRE